MRHANTLTPVPVPIWVDFFKKIAKDAKAISAVSRKL